MIGWPCCILESRGRQGSPEKDFRRYDVAFYYKTWLNFLPKQDLMQWMKVL